MPFYSMTRLNSLFTVIAFAMVASSQSALADTWQWQLSVGQLDQDYQETDSTGLTTDGILNSETGAIPVLELAVINTTHPINLLNNQWTPYGKLQLRHAQGDTDYDGYLQTGATLTPYRTITDNTLTQVDFDLGLGYGVNQTLILTPLVSVSHERWERKLEQYTEDFDHTALLAGANIDWQPSRQMPLTLQLQAKAGKLIDSNIDVPKLGLKQDIGHSTISQIGIAGQYDLSEHLSMNAGISKQRWEYEQSDIQNNYQYPDSESEQTLWQLGFGYEF